MSAFQRPSTVKGMHDLLPPESAKVEFLESTCRQVLDGFGYREVRTPILEYTPLFVRSIGEATDIVEKEMYTFEDRDSRSMTMRPEGTASVVRAFIEHAVAERDPVTKWFYMGPMFRHERPQRGRLRQFHQVGAEAFGIEGPSIDSELVTMCWRMIVKLGVAHPALRISSIGCKDCRPAFRATLTAFLKHHEPSLCEDCRKRLQHNPLRVLDCKREGCAKARQGAPAPLDELCPACQAHFTEVHEGLRALEIPFEIDRMLVRGLDYYTRTTFEITSGGEEIGSQNAILGGGRYDGLVAELGGPAIPAIGFALGVERALLAIPQEGSHFQPPIDVFVVALGEAARRWASVTADRLRQAGFRVDVDHRGGSFKSQLRRADKLGVKVAVVAGENELARHSVLLKILATGDQREIDESELATEVRRAI